MLNLLLLTYNIFASKLVSLTKAIILEQQVIRSQILLVKDEVPHCRRFAAALLRGGFNPVREGKRRRPATCQDRIYVFYVHLARCNFRVPDY